MNPQRDCKEFKVETRTITEVQSEPIYPTGRCGPVLARIPVVISQSKVHIDIESRFVLTILFLTSTAIQGIYI